MLTVHFKHSPRNVNISWVFLGLQFNEMLEPENWKKAYTNIIILFATCMFVYENYKYMPISIVGD